MSNPRQNCLLAIFWLLSSAAIVRAAPPPVIPAARLVQAGLKVYQGKHITLYSDADEKHVKDLPRVFDQAVEPWQKYFQLKPAEFHVVGNVLAGKASQPKFAAVELWRQGIPEFLNGYAHPDMFWMFDQPSSEYYRRHLLLHEGVHSFMLTRLGSCGPAWYREGMAELLATHQLEGDKLTLPYFPRNKEEVPMWGRVKIVTDACEANRGVTFDGVLKFGDRDHLMSNTPYGWSWAMTAFLDGHPRWQKRFRELPAKLNDEDFNARMREAYAADWNELAEEWQVFATGLSYGHDLPRSAIEFRPGKSFTGKSQVTVAADRGWQSSGLTVEAGQKYRITAAGRYQIAKTSKAWDCEPGGVSVRYIAGRPLGMLLAAVRTEPVTGNSGLLAVEPIGLSATLSPEKTGVLYFRVNDSPAELADNAGTLKVTVERE